MSRAMIHKKLASNGNVYGLYSGRLHVGFALCVQSYAAIILQLDHSRFISSHSQFLHQSSYCKTLCKPSSSCWQCCQI